MQKANSGGTLHYTGAGGGFNAGGTQMLQQQPQISNTSQYGIQQGVDRVQQLKMERNYLQERRQELFQQGLLDQQQESPHQTQTAVQQQFGSPPCVMPQDSPYESAPSTTHNNFQMRQIVDNQMEIDYQQDDSSQEPLIDTALVQVTNRCVDQQFHLVGAPQHRHK